MSFAKLILYEYTTDVNLRQVVADFPYKENLSIQIIEFIFNEKPPAELIYKNYVSYLSDLPIESLIMYFINLLAIRNKMRSDESRTQYIRTLVSLMCTIPGYEEIRFNATIGTWYIDNFKIPS